MGRWNALHGLALGVVVGGAAGALLAWRPIPRTVEAALEGAVGRRAEGEEAAPHATAPLAPAAGERADAHSERAEPAEGSDALTERSSVDELLPLLHEGLIAHAREGLAEGWRSERPDEMPVARMEEGLEAYESLVIESPPVIGRELAQRQTKKEDALEDARTGGVFALLESLDAGGAGPIIETVADRGKFQTFFSRDAKESVVNGALDLRHPDAAVEEGTTLSFAAGVYRLRGLMVEKDPFPRDVTIAGAGMDATLLLFNDLHTRGLLRNFTVRDCTVFTESDELLDLRSKPASVQLERVRLIGFDSGAGGSDLLGTKGLALWARDCVIVGGYGRSPQHASLLDVRTDALAARFERCRIERVDLELEHVREGATLVFSACTLADILRDPMPAAAKKKGVRFDQCTIQVFPGTWQDVPKLDLNDLFPDWRARIRE